MIFFVGIFRLYFNYFILLIFNCCNTYLITQVSDGIRGTGTEETGREETSTDLPADTAALDPTGHPAVNLLEISGIIGTAGITDTAAVVAGIHLKSAYTRTRNITTSSHPLGMTTEEVTTRCLTTKQMTLSPSKTAQTSSSSSSTRRTTGLVPIRCE